MEPSQLSCDCTVVKSCPTVVITVCAQVCVCASPSPIHGELAHVQIVWVVGHLRLVGAVLREGVAAGLQTLLLHRVLVRVVVHPVVLACNARETRFRCSSGQQQHKGNSGKTVVVVVGGGGIALRPSPQPRPVFHHRHGVFSCLSFGKVAAWTQSHSSKGSHRIDPILGPTSGTTEICQSNFETHTCDTCKKDRKQGSHVVPRHASLYKLQVSGCCVPAFDAVPATRATATHAVRPWVTEHLASVPRDFHAADHGDIRALTVRPEPLLLLVELPLDARRVRGQNDLRLGREEPVRRENDVHGVGVVQVGGVQQRRRQRPCNARDRDFLQEEETSTWDAGHT